MANRILTRLAVLALSGCATCREHPVACAAVGAVLVGSAVALIAHRHRAPFAASCLEYYEQRGATPAEAQHDCR